MYLTGDESALTVTKQKALTFIEEQCCRKTIVLLV